MNSKYQNSKEEIKNDSLKDCATCGDKHYSDKCVYLDFNIKKNYCYLLMGNSYTIASKIEKEKIKAQYLM